jgi:hypothetical protein
VFVRAGPSRETTINSVYCISTVLEVGILKSNESSK